MSILTCAVLFFRMEQSGHEPPLLGSPTALSASSLMSPAPFVIGFD